MKVVRRNHYHWGRRWLAEHKDLPQAGVGHQGRIKEMEVEGFLYDFLRNASIWLS